jgi:hypothetical protein
MSLELLRRGICPICRRSRGCPGHAPNAAWSREQHLAQALTNLLNHYTQLINSGDAGNWDPEAEPVVIAARQALNLHPPLLKPATKVDPS